MQPKLSGLICEDVRFEASGKYILVGAYSNGIITPYDPFNFNFILFFLARGLPPGRTDFEVEMETANGIIPSAPFFVDVEEGFWSGNAILPASLVHEAKPEFLKISARMIGSDTYSEIVNLPIVDAVPMDQD